MSLHKKYFVLLLRHAIHDQKIEYALTTLLDVTPDKISKIDIENDIYPHEKALVIFDNMEFSEGFRGYLQVFIDHKLCKQHGLNSDMDLAMHISRLLKHDVLIETEDYNPFIYYLVQQNGNIYLANQLYAKQKEGAYQQVSIDEKSLRLVSSVSTEIQKVPSAGVEQAKPHSASSKN